MIDHPEESSNQLAASKPSSVDSTPPFPTAKPLSEATTPTLKERSTATASSSKPTLDVVPPPEPATDIAPSSRTTSAKTLMHVFEHSGLDINGSCTQLLQIIDRSLLSVLFRESYERVLDDLEARLDYEVTGEVESEDE